jgi:hypothetical protein
LAIDIELIGSFIKTIKSHLRIFEGLEELCIFDRLLPNGLFTTTKAASQINLLCICCYEEVRNRLQAIGGKANFLKV